MFTELIKKYTTKKTSQLSSTEPEFFQFLRDTTTFLPNSASSTQRLWHHRYNVFNLPTCEGCGNTVNWDIVNQTYRKYCSKTCAGTTIQNIRASTFTPHLCVVCGESTASKLRLTCSVSCREQYDLQQASIVLTKTELIDQIKAMLPIVNYVGFKSTYPCLYANIQRNTQHLTKSYQLKQRIDYLLSPDELDLKITQQQERIALAATLGISPLEIDIRAKYSSDICPRCTNQQRPVNLASRTLRKWCDTCTTLFNAEKLMPKPIKVLPLHYIANKNMDPRLNNRDWLIDQHYDKKLTKQQLATLLDVDKETISNRFKLYGIASIKHKYKTAQQNEVRDFLKSLGVVNIVENDRALVKPKTQKRLDSLRFTTVGNSDG